MLETKAGTYEVLVDVRGSLIDPDALKSTFPGTCLSLLDIALGTWHLRDDIHRQSIGKVACASSVQHCFIRAGPIRGHDVEYA
jgi:hypothetical protein